MNRKFKFLSHQTKTWAFAVLALLITQAAIAQQWVDTVYQIEVHKDIIYGTAVNFAGKTDTLKLDIYLPANDTAPTCGRPVFIGIHGGGWYAGHKGEGIAASMARDFAKRGFVGVSINYRLGLFNTHQNIHCNIPGWDCWNMADTAEWYRANYRGIVDAQTALFFLSGNAEEYNINLENVFVAGESAGGFIALGLGFIDDEEEIMHSLVDSIAAVRPPHQIYEAACIQNNHLAGSILDMDTLRPQLEPLAIQNLPYVVKGVANFYGGAFNNIFKSHYQNPPILYMFHQPCDLLVPYTNGKILKEFSNCLQQFPANCASIVNRPYIYGSKGISVLIDEMISEGVSTSSYHLSSTSNNYSCLQQLDQTMACHAIDNYWVRTKEMAHLFASRVDTCMPLSVANHKISGEEIKLWPNPATHEIQLLSAASRATGKVLIYDLAGRLRIKEEHYNFNSSLDVSQLSAGVYIIQIIEEQQYQMIKFVKEQF